MPYRREETPEQREERQRKSRERKAERRARETPEERAERLRKSRERAEFRRTHPRSEWPSRNRRQRKQEAPPPPPPPPTYTSRVVESLRILGLPDNLIHYTPEGKEAIKKAFRKLALTHHPDKGGDSERFKAINGAYAYLMGNDY